MLLTDSNIKSISFIKSINFYSQCYYVLGTVKASGDTEVSKKKKASAVMELPRQINVTNTDMYKEENNSG